eukprot:TRINITY_DN473_c0_g1_i1.p1 TRINITY_DN473_c0_g1~~TRINITY_DN473_c0_g1_i1.p1  ORF type:complete len:223 (+),score=21.46 TRINITY_DN473_c0_g1_i1:575-1243(+)
MYMDISKFANVLSSHPSYVLATALAVGPIVTLYYLFSKQKLPEIVARRFGRLWHHFTLPIILVFQRLGLRGKLYSYVDEDEKVILSSIPMHWDVQHFHNLGVRAVVNLCDEYSGPEQAYRQYGIKQLYLPTIDHHEPTLSHLKQAVEFIEQYTKRGDVVMIHCRAGRGRSAAVAFCWLLYKTKMQPEEIQRHLLSRRKKVRKTLYLQPNILKYYEHISKSQL